MRLTSYISTIILALAFFSCKGKRKDHQIVDISKFKQSNNIIHCVDSDDESKDCNCPSQFNLNDSDQLTAIKDQFYKSNTGHLYERTFSDKEVNGHLTAHEYFNGYFSQEVDPLSFEPLEGWYAKDKDHVYLCRPTSGGMLIWKIEEADVRSFTILQGHYNYAVDKKHVYNESTLLKNIQPGNLKIFTDEQGFVTKIVSGKYTYSQ